MYIYSHTHTNAKELESTCIQHVSKMVPLGTKKNTFLTEMGGNYKKKNKKPGKWDEDEVPFVAQTEISISSQALVLHKEFPNTIPAVPPSPPLWPVRLFLHWWFPPAFAFLESDFLYPTHPSTTQGSSPCSNNVIISGLEMECVLARKEMPNGVRVLLCFFFNYKGKTFG